MGKEQKSWVRATAEVLAYMSLMFAVEKLFEEMVEETE